MFRRILLATVMVSIAAVMSAPAAQIQDGPRARLARINFFTNDGCTGDEWTMDVVEREEEGCWNTNNIGSIEVMQA